MTALWVIVLCGVLSIVYGVWATASVLNADAGTPRMQEIAAAIQEGAQAYLKRQYTTIAIVGVVVFALHRACFLGLIVGGRLRDRRDPVGRRRLHRHEHLGARQRAHRAAATHVAGRRA